jgi:hypothetical protein
MIYNKKNKNSVLKWRYSAAIAYLEGERYVMQDYHAMALYTFLAR